MLNTKLQEHILLTISQIDKQMYVSETKEKMKVKLQDISSVITIHYDIIIYFSIN